MAKAIALYEGGIHYRIEKAVREDGVVFERAQEKDPRYGYKWTRWQATGTRLGDNEKHNPEPSIPAGFSILSRRMPGDYGWRNVRLPN